MLSKKELTHQRILTTAAKMIRQNGFEALAVADLMKKSGLTHGGFYAHFANRDALIAEALEFARSESAMALAQELPVKISEGKHPLAAFIEIYLSEQHLTSCIDGQGCPVAALGSEFFRLDTDTKSIAANTIEAYIDKLIMLSGQKLNRDNAFVLTATLVGSLQLARGLADTGKAQAYLAASREDLIQRYLDS